MQQAVLTARNPSFEHAFDLSVRPPPTRGPREELSSRPCWDRRFREGSSKIHKPLERMPQEIDVVDIAFDFSRSSRWMITLSCREGGAIVEVPYAFSFYDVPKCHQLAPPDDTVPSEGEAPGTNVQREAMTFLQAEFSSLITEQVRGHHIQIDSNFRLALAYDLAFARLLRSSLGFLVRTIEPERFEVEVQAAGTRGERLSFFVKAFDTGMQQRISFPLSPIDVLPDYVLPPWIQLVYAPSVEAEQQTLRALEYLAVTACQLRDEHAQLFSECWRISELLIANNRFALSHLQTRLRPAYRPLGFFPAKRSNGQLYVSLSSSFVRNDLFDDYRPKWDLTWATLPKDLPWYWLQWACERATAALISGIRPSVALRGLLELVACLDESVGYTSDADLCPDTDEIDDIETQLLAVVDDDAGTASPWIAQRAKQCAKVDRRHQVQTDSVALARSLQLAVGEDGRVEDFAGRDIGTASGEYANSHLKPSVDKADLVMFSPNAQLHHPENVNWVTQYQNRLKGVWSIFVLVGLLQLMGWASAFLTSTTVTEVDLVEQILSCAAAKEIASAIQDAAALERDSIPYKIAKRVGTCEKIARSTYALLDRLISFPSSGRRRPFKAGGLTYPAPPINTVPRRVRTFQVHTKATLAKQNTPEWHRAATKITAFAAEIEEKFGPCTLRRCEDVAAPNPWEGDGSIRTLWSALRAFGPRQIRLHWLCDRRVNTPASVDRHTLFLAALIRYGRAGSDGTGGFSGDPWLGIRLMTDTPRDPFRLAIGHTEPDRPMRICKDFDDDPSGLALIKRCDSVWDFIDPEKVDIEVQSAAINFCWGDAGPEERKQIRDDAQLVARSFSEGLHGVTVP